MIDGRCLLQILRLDLHQPVFACLRIAFLLKPLQTCHCYNEHVLRFLFFKEKNCILPLICDSFLGFKRSLYGVVINESSN